MIPHEFDVLAANLPYGIVVVAPNAAILHSNGVARRLFANGSTVASIDGTLAAKDRAADKHLKNAIQTVTESLERQHPDDLTQLQILPSRMKNFSIVASISRFSNRISVVAQQFEVGQNTALIIFADRSVVDHIDRRSIQNLFGLTVTETNILFHLCAGLSVSQVADKTHSSTNSVRFHLKSLFSKTSTNRQADLIHIILSSPAVRLN